MKLDDEISPKPLGVRLWTDDVLHTGGKSSDFRGMNPREDGGGWGPVRDQGLVQVEDGAEKWLEWRGKKTNN